MRAAPSFSEGDAARNVFVICFGQVKISSTSRDGKTMILKIAGPGDVMGLSAVLANVPHEVTAEAIEPCQVKTVRKQEFVDFLGRHGIASMHAAQSLSGEYLTVFHDAKRLALSGSAAGRLARLLLDWGRSSANGKPEIRFTMALTHEEIANMAGTSRETVTRLLNQFRRDQWITIKGSSLTIVKPDQARPTGTADRGAEQQLAKPAPAPGSEKDAIALNCRAAVDNLLHSTPFAHQPVADDVAAARRFAPGLNDFSANSSAADGS
jgi:CRP/FNR family transcriptional regulator, cyclic AMP receptor protein